MSIKKPDAEQDDEPDTSELGGQLRGSGSNAEGTEVLGDSPEDVLVLLPEGTDIPIVETEAVDGPPGAPTIPIEDVALRDLNPLAEDAPLAPVPEAATPTENLEELASEMDDEFLAPESPAPAARAVRSPPAERSAGRSIPQFLPSVDQGAGRGRPRRRLPLAIAAVLALAAAGYLTFPQWKPYVEAYLPGVASAAGKKTLPAASKKGAASVSGKKTSGLVSGAGATAAVDVVRASKEAFREKFLLSIELGYVGEVADE